MPDTQWTTADIPDQTGRSFVVTGANSGLGREATKALAACGAHVIMAVRNQVKGKQARDELLADQPGAHLEVRALDLIDLASVRAFADGLHSDGKAVDVLINNAGVMMPPRSLNSQGQEIQFAGNHLGHFALTGLLLDILGTSADPRVVTVSSNLHRRGSIHFDDVTGSASYSPSSFYAQSKFANILFGLELDRRLRAAGSPIKSLLAHPGYSATNLQTSGPTGLAKFFSATIGNRLLAQSASMGALPELFAATDPAAESGQYFGPDGRNEMKGHPTVVRPVPAADDPATARRLWELSEELTGVRFDLPAAA